MLDQWLGAKTTEGEVIPMRDIEDQLVTHVLGGPYALATILGGLGALMASYPRIMRRAQQEIDDALVRGILSQPSPLYSECCQLQYVSACIREALRITSTASPRWRSSDRVLNLLGQDTRPRTAIATSPFAISTSKSIYGTDTNLF
ncbi:hypothetical protein BGW36DRAFT_433266 [Talaromyces proteolyticus]|uniref:Cytochrome P450 n=1 Tax=Talaromyces proteolyticus TaxID=1131652 RepID=A0AAD4KEG8_9EURO|nr:uncharacterized protein BGW36DRAFT_433266 [Talaromyces proteolyticus]KAH8690317.1 hypothetical protein BGW36DRAFT_433266 [Talaromyces proteolyticus]